MPISATILACALLMMLVEATRPGRSFPPIAHWYARAAIL